MKKNIILFFTVLLFCGSAVQAAVQKKAVKKDTIVQAKEVVVTALRYPESSIEVPMAVSVFDVKQLTNSRGYGMGEILNRVPGVLAQSRSGNQDVRFTIRGFGTRGAGDRSNSGTSRGIKFIIDGTPETEPDGRTSFDNFDLSLANRVEIIRSNSSGLLPLVTVTTAAVLICVGLAF